MSEMKHVHFLGIGGSGASAIASIAKAYGFQVSGCDKQPINEYTAHLDPKTLLTGHSEEHLKDIDILAVTPAVYSFDPDNPEIKAAKEKGIEVLTWQEFMGKYLEEGKYVIAICGTKGKSTTTAMVGLMLEEAGLDPTVELGAIVPKWGANYRVGKSKYFVTEADEFNNNFFASIPNIAIVTNVEYEHPEFFNNFTIYKQSFYKFLRRTKFSLIVNCMDPGVRSVIEMLKKGKRINLIDYSSNLIDFPLEIPGEFNRFNASAVYQLGLALQIEPPVIEKSLSSFKGIGRRFERLGEINGAEIYSDYAHNPLSIKLTTQAAREEFPKAKLWIIYEPHMFSRTKALFKDFVKVFKQIPADKVTILDIFPSREIDKGEVSSKQLVEAINSPKVEYLVNTNQLEGILTRELERGDVVFFMGAGPIDKMARDLVKNYAD